MKTIVTASLLVVVLGLGACSGRDSPRTMDVVATAYTLAQEETKKGNVGLAAEPEAVTSCNLNRTGLVVGRVLLRRHGLFQHWFVAQARV